MEDGQPRLIVFVRGDFIISGHVVSCIVIFVHDAYNFLTKEKKKKKEMLGKGKFLDEHLCAMR